MLVAVMRHGKAEPKGSGVPDEERRLTSEGRRQVEETSRLLPFKPSIVYTSPLRRARESADILALIHGVTVEVREELLPNKFTYKELLSIARERAVLVGHAPSVEEAISSLTGCRLKMKTASITVIDLDPEGATATLLALIIPPTASLP